MRLAVFTVSPLEIKLFKIKIENLIFLNISFGTPEFQKFRLFYTSVYR